METNKGRQPTVTYTHMHTQVHTHEHVPTSYTHVIHLEKLNLIKCKKKKKDILTFEKVPKNTLLRKK